MCGVDLILLEAADCMFFQSLKHFPPGRVTSVGLALTTVDVGGYDGWVSIDSQTKLSVCKIPFSNHIFDHGVFK